MISSRYIGFNVRLTHRNNATFAPAEIRPWCRRAEIVIYAQTPNAGLDLYKLLRLI
jgi:hypothetical protein